MLTQIFTQFFLVACVSVGGFTSSLPGLYTFLVLDANLITPQQFSAAVTFGQTMPGPNTVVSPLLGYSAAGIPGAFCALAGTLIPGIVMALLFGRFIRSHNQNLWIRAYKTGLAPIIIGLMLASGIFLLQGVSHSLWTIPWALGAALLVWIKSTSPLILLAAGAAAGITALYF